MAPTADKSDVPPKQLAELSALADGSLDPARADAVRERIARSPEMSALYERERRVVELMHEARAERAPDRLRAAIEAQRPSRSVRTRRRVAWSGAFAGALAAVALAAVLILPAGTPGSPSVSQAAALASRGVAFAAPTHDLSGTSKLNDNLGDVYFPDWGRTLGWRAVGQRSDHLGGRLALTVFYDGLRGQRIAYTIVDAPALPEPHASVTTLHGTRFRTLQLGGRLVVTWRRDNHTCVLSGHGVPGSVLRRLAAWRA